MMKNRVKNPFKRRQKREKDSQNDQQNQQQELVSPPTQPGAEEQRGGRVQVPSQQFPQHPPPQILVQPGTGNSSQSLTVINKIYYNIFGFPEKGDKKSKSFVRSNWPLLILLFLILVLIVVVIALLAAAILSGKTEGLKLTDWEQFGKILGAAAGTAYDGFCKMFTG